MCVQNGLLQAEDHMVVVQRVKDAYMIKVKLSSHGFCTSADDLMLVSERSTSL